MDSSRVRGNLNFSPPYPNGCAMSENQFTVYDGSANMAHVSATKYTDDGVIIRVLTSGTMTTGTLVLQIMAVQ